MPHMNAPPISDDFHVKEYGKKLRVRFPASPEGDLPAAFSDALAALADQTEQK